MTFSDLLSHTTPIHCNESHNDSSNLFEYQAVRRLGLSKTNASFSKRIAAKDEKRLFHPRLYEQRNSYNCADRINLKSAMVSGYIESYLAHILQNILIRFMSHIIIYCISIYK